MSVRRQAKVYVQGKAFNEITRTTFLNEKKYEIVGNIDDSEIVVWTGGEDINPALYEEKPIPGTYYNNARDKSDLLAVDVAVKQNKFLVGICRGAQLLNVIPNGGKLWQDIDNHNYNNHKAYDCLTGSWIKVNSVHHQAMRVTDEAEIICWALESTYKDCYEISWNKPTDVTTIPEKDKDIEACWYPKTRSLLFQGHPEFGDPPTTAYFFDLMDKYYWKAA